MIFVTALKTLSYITICFYYFFFFLLTVELRPWLLTSNDFEVHFSIADRSTIELRWVYFHLHVIIFVLIFLGENVYFSTNYIGSYSYVHLNEWASMILYEYRIFSLKLIIKIIKSLGEIFLFNSIHFVYNLFITIFFFFFYI